MIRFTLLTLMLFMTHIASAQEWAATERFDAENAALPAAGPDRVVFMGDSITEGWPRENPEFFDGKPYVNRAISGQTTAQMLIRFRQDVVALEPALVVILAGTNDIAHNAGPVPVEIVAGHIQSMVELARFHGIDVIVSSVLPAADYPWRPGLEPHRRIPELNALLKAYCDAESVPYLDYFTEMADDRNGLPPEFAADGVHPTRDGYLVMSALAAPAIESVLADRRQR